MSNESKCPGHNRAECVSCCWPKADLVWGENIGLSDDDVRSLHGSHYTAVDMTTAAAQGFRDGAASVVVELPKRFEIMEEIEGDTMRVLHNLSAKTWNSCLEDCAKAIIAAGGSIKGEKSNG